VLTIFSGGSVGKEGPGAQIGAGAASWLSDMLKFSEEYRRKLVICGISAGFASVFGTPIAATIMAVELFGLEIAHYAALSAVISFLITGHRSVFASQILAMKKSEILEVKVGEVIEHAEVDLEESKIGRIRNIRERIRRRREKFRQKRAGKPLSRKEK